MKYSSIQEARRSLGLSQDDMASELGVVRQTYSKMEQNPETMTIREARLVCSILGKKFEEIFFGQMVNFNSPNEVTTS